MGDLKSAIREMCKWCPECRGAGIVTSLSAEVHCGDDQKLRVSEYATKLGCKRCIKFRAMAGLPTFPVEPLKHSHGPPRHETIGAT